MGHEQQIGFVCPSCGSDLFRNQDANGVIYSCLALDCMEVWEESELVESDQVNQPMEDHSLSEISGRLDSIFPVSGSVESPDGGELIGFEIRVHSDIAQALKTHDDLVAERDRLLAEKAELVDVLEPFAALSDVINFYRHEDNSTSEHRLWASDIRRARAAIAKARGEQS